MKSFSALFVTVFCLGLRSALGFDGVEPLFFGVNAMRQQLPGTMPSTMIYITIDTNKFVLRKPEECRMFVDAARHSLNLSWPDNLCKLSVRIIAAPDDTAPDDATDYRRWLYEAHPGAKILRESTAYASGLKGPAFSLQWPRAENLFEAEQVAYLPCPAGVFEFSVTSVSSHADEAAQKLQLIFDAFRAPVNGKLQAPFLSGQN